MIFRARVQMSRYIYHVKFHECARGYFILLVSTTRWVLYNAVFVETVFGKRAEDNESDLHRSRLLHHRTKLYHKIITIPIQRVQCFQTLRERRRVRTRVRGVSLLN